MSLAGVEGDARSCGTCRQCCKLVAVRALSKPAFRWCDHAGPGGCGIYERRPTECRTYRCWWLSGYLPEELRPDQSKVVLDDELLLLSDGRLVMALVLHESQPGILATNSLAQRVLRRVEAMADQYRLPIKLRSQGDPPGTCRGRWPAGLPEAAKPADTTPAERAWYRDQMTGWLERKEPLAQKPPVLEGRP